MQIFSGRGVECVAVTSFAYVGLDFNPFPGQAAEWFGPAIGQQDPNGSEKMKLGLKLAS